MRKILTFILLILAVLGFATWQYRLLMVLFIVMLNRSTVANWLPKWRHSYKTLVATLVLAIIVAIPNYWQRGRIQLHYLDDNGKRIATPMLVYAINVICPEEELMNIGMKINAFIPQSSWIKTHFGIGGRLTSDARQDFWTGKARSFYAPYNRISLCASNPGCAPIAQVCNQFLGTNYDGLYIIKPNNYDDNKEYPVVFFCHGYLGNWELYNGLWCRLKDCIVVSIGTRDLSGIFTQKDINNVFTKYLPYLKSEGYRINEKQIHLMGLSNGGSAADIAFRYFSSRLKSIVYISTPCNVVKHANTKILLIGGGKDVAATGLPSAHKKLRNCGTPTALFYDKDDNHFIAVKQADEMLDFLNKEMLGHD